MIPLKDSSFGLMSSNTPKLILFLMEDNEVIDETAYLLRSPADASRLIEWIEEVERGLIKKVSTNSLLKPQKQRSLGLLKDIIKLQEDFVEHDDEITKLFTD